MFTGFIGAQISRANRNLFIGNVIFLLLVALCAFAGKKSFQNLIAGPKEMTIDQIVAVRDPDSLDRYFVKATVDPRKYDSHYMELTGNKAADNGFYYYYHTEDASIAVRSNLKDPPATIEGTIEKPGTRVADHVMTNGPIDLNRNAYIDSTGFRSGPITAAIFVILCAALAVWNLWKAVGRSFDPAKSPIARRLARWGNPVELARQIDAELPRAHQTGNVITTDSWLIRRSTYGMTLLNFDDVIWSYKTATKRYTNGIYTGTSYATTIHDRQRKTTGLQLKEPQTLQLLADIAARAPWSLIGYDAALKKDWQKDANKLIAAVDERKKQYQAAPRAAAVPPPLPPGRSAAPPPLPPGTGRS